MVTHTLPKKKFPEAQNPLILRAHRLMEAFAKSDDERDFYLDRIEGFIIYVDLDKTAEELDLLIKEVESFPERYCPIPKLTFFETKKIMEGFVNEKVYDIDTKEKLLDIIQSKEGRENFLEFIYDHHHEFEKWQQYYQERSRIRIIEWLRGYHYHFVFEEDLELPSHMIEKLKHSLFQKGVSKELEVARKTLTTKAKTYYSNEALNPRPKRGRPPKQQEKIEVEPQISSDIYTNVPPVVRPFLFTPEISSIADITFSSRFETTKELIDKKHSFPSDMEEGMHSIGQKIAQLRQLSNRWMEQEAKENVLSSPSPKEIPPKVEKEDQKLFKKLGEQRKKIQEKAPKKEKIIPSSPQKKIIKKIDLETKEKLPKKLSHTTSLKKIIPDSSSQKEKLKKKLPLRGDKVVSDKEKKKTLSPTKKNLKTSASKAIKQAPKKTSKRSLFRLTPKKLSKSTTKKVKEKFKPLKKLLKKPSRKKM